MRKYGGYRSGDLFITEKLNFQKDFYFYDCARQAINALCKTLRFGEIFTPNYYCKPVDDYLSNSSVQIHNYPISGFSDYQFPSYKANTLLIIPNFFGLSNIKHLIDLAKSRFKWPANQILVDSSLSLFDFVEMDKSVSYVFSPRKFLPITEGGIIYSPHCQLTIGEVLNVKEHNFRSQLLDPKNLLSEKGTQVYRETEQSFCTANVLTKLDQNLISKIETIDINRYYDLFNTARNHFSQFEGLIGANPRRPGNCVLIDRSKIVNLDVQRLGKGVFNAGTEYKIFIPKYWGNIAPSTDFEYFLINEVIFIPVFWDISAFDIQQIKRFIYGDKN